MVVVESFETDPDATSFAMSTYMQASNQIIYSRVRCKIPLTVSSATCFLRGFLAAAGVGASEVVAAVAVPSADGGLAAAVGTVVAKVVVAVGAVGAVGAVSAVDRGG